MANEKKDALRERAEMFVRDMFTHNGSKHVRLFSDYAPNGVYIGGYSIGVLEDYVEELLKREREYALKGVKGDA